MSERIELRTDVTAAAGIRGVRQSREMRPDETKKKFSDEFERRLSRENKKKESEPDEDEIIIGGEDPAREKDADEDDQDDKEKNRHGGPALPERPGVNKIDLIA